MRRQLVRLGFGFILPCFGVLPLSATAWHPGESVMSAPSGELASRQLPNLIRDALAAGETTLRIPAGRYYVKPENGTHLRLENLEGVTIDARGVEMVCSETTRAILIENCRDLTIRGLTIDYDPLPYTQGEIVEISEDRKSHIIRIQEGFPPADSAIVFKHLIYKPDRSLRFGHYYEMSIEVLPNNHLRISGLHPRKDGGEQVGDTVVISSETLRGRYDPHAVHLYQSEDILIEDVTLYASPCFGFFEEHCTGSVFRNCRVDRRDGRLHSLNADAFHSKFAKVGPRIENCFAMWMGDDAVNICGAYHVVVGGEGRRLRVLAKRQMDIETGDPVQLLSVAGEGLSPARVVSIERDGSVTEAERTELAALPLLPDVVELLEKAYVLELDREVDLPTGSVIGSLNRMGNGFSVLGCEFGNIRSRGILVKASNGTIVDNTLMNCSLQGIKIGPEYLWLESGFTRNLRIEGNRVLHSGAESILVDSPGPYALHRDLEIIGNEVVSDSMPLVRLRGLLGGLVSGNDFATEHGRLPAQPVVLEHSEGVVGID